MHSLVKHQDMPIIRMFERAVHEEWHCRELIADGHCSLANTWTVCMQKTMLCCCCDMPTVNKPSSDCTMEACSRA